MENAFERIEKLLAMILVQDCGDAPQAQKALALSRAGFANKEVAELLGTTAAVVGQQLYEVRTGKKGKAKKKR